MPERERPGETHVTMALDDIVVLDLGQIYNGPYCSLLLAHMGARVIKIEPPEGESMRQRLPGEEIPAFLLMNSHREGLALDLKDPDGHDIFMRLVAGADVVIENYAEGTMERLGIGYDALAAVNPRIIVGSGKGFDPEGPWAGRLAMDLTVQAMTAVMSVTGFPEMPPVKAGAQIADIMGGVTLAVGVLGALHQRSRTGEGQHVKVSMQDAVIPALASNIAGYLETGGTLPERTGNRQNGLAVAPYNVYETSDGWVAIFCVSEPHWHKLLDVMGERDRFGGEEFATMPRRAARMDEIDAVVESWTRTRTVEEILEVLDASRIPSAPLLHVSDLLESEWFRREGGMLEHVPHPTLHDARAFGSPIKLSASDRRPVTRAPYVGEHTVRVLSGDLGLTDDEIADLRGRGVVKWPTGDG